MNDPFPGGPPLRLEVTLLDGRAFGSVTTIAEEGSSGAFPLDSPATQWLASTDERLAAISRALAQARAVVETLEGRSSNWASSLAQSIYEEDGRFGGDAVEYWLTMSEVRPVPVTEQGRCVCCETVDW